MADEARIDKWLWSVRIYKTRSLAAEACKKGRVTIGDIATKASRTIKAGDIIQVKKSPVTYTYRVIEPIQNRVGAKLVNQYTADLTPQEELDKAISRSGNSFFFFDKGKGRPTKKTRRDIDQFLDQ